MSIEALIVFAKAPRAGHVKTRLTPILSEADAAALYEAFLRDALDQYVRLGAAVRLYVPEPNRLPDDVVPEGVTVCRQEGATLGPRMQHAFLQTFAAGYERLVIIGTDHPTLPIAFVKQAFITLGDPMSMTIGPTEDGGYYLLGMNDFFPQLFAGMRYSHGDVFEQTLDRAAQTGARLNILPSWYDVDTPADLERLAAELLNADIDAENTRRVLARLDGRGAR